MIKLVYDIVSYIISTLNWAINNLIVAIVSAANFLVWFIATIWGWLNWLINEALSVDALIAMAALLVAVLIPVALFLAESTRDSGFRWDQAVIAKKVINAPMLYFAFFMLSIPLVFWDVAIPLKPLLVVLFIAGVFIVSKSLLQAYKWMIVNESGPRETYRTKMRLAYLSSLKANDRAAVWSLTWTKDDADRALIDERVLVKTFLDQIQDTYSTPESARDMLQSFFGYFEHLRLDDPVIYEQVLEFAVRAGEGLYTRTPTNAEVGEYSFRHTARRLFFAVMNRSLKQSFMSYMFYDQLKKIFATLTKSKQLKILKSVAANFFPDDPDDDSDEAWHDFPDEWKVTDENLTNSNKDYAFVWLNAYMRWITSRRIYSSSDDFILDKAIDRVTEHLLPKIEPILWGQMFSLHWAPYGTHEGEDNHTAQVRNWIQSNRTFGHISRPGEMTLITAEDPDAHEREFWRRETEQEQEIYNINKHTNVFPRFRTIESLQEYINAAENLALDDEREVNMQANLIAMLRSIQKSLE